MFFELRVEPLDHVAGSLTAVLEFRLRIFDDLQQRGLGLLAGDLASEEQPEPIVNVADGTLDRGVDHGLDLLCTWRRHGCSR